MLTLGQAAKESGLSKTAISRAIKNGRLSATRNDLGEYQIDPAELFRVYPVTVNVDSQPERHATPKEHTGLQAQLDVMREERERERQQLQATIDDLRRRLDTEAEERRTSATEIRRLTLLLTDQRPKPEEAPRPPLPALNAAPWLWATFAMAASSAAVWLWWAGRN